MSIKPTSALVESLRFFTIIPLGSGTHHDISQYVRYFPITGLIIALIASVVGWLAHALFGNPVASALIILAIAVLTGGLHLDGLSDTADAAFSWRSIDEKLRIMRDSRIGAMGASALCLFLITKTTALISLGEQWFIPLLVSTMLGKLSIAYAMTAFSSPRSDGLSSERPSDLSAQFTFAALFCLFVLVAILPLVFTLTLKNYLLLAFSVGLIIQIAYRLSKCFSGLTGDTYGALAEITELLVLLSLTQF